MVRYHTQRETCIKLLIRIRLPFLKACVYAYYRPSKFIKISGVGSSLTLSVSKCGDDFEIVISSALASLDMSLTSAGASKGDIVNINVTTNDMSNTKQIDIACDAWLDKSNPPLFTVRSLSDSREDRITVDIVADVFVCKTVE